jgi:hypothetical protein
LSQTKFNNDFGRAQDQLVTGRRSKAEHLGRGRQVLHGKLDSSCRNKKPIGLFHELSIELQYSLLITSKRKAPESRQKFRESLQIQCECHFEKKQAVRSKKVQGEMAHVMANS